MIRKEKTRLNNNYRETIKSEGSKMIRKMRNFGFQVGYKIFSIYNIEKRIYKENHLRSLGSWEFHNIHRTKYWFLEQTLFQGPDNMCTE